MKINGPALVAASLLSVMAASTAAVADYFNSSSTTTVSGSVQSVDITNGNVLLKDRRGNTQTLQTTSTSTVSVNGAATNVNNIKPGDKVTVQNGTPVEQQ